MTPDDGAQPAAAEAAHPTRALPTQALRPDSQALSATERVDTDCLVTEALIQGPVSPPGHKIGRYRIVGVLGRGGMGEVYEVDFEGESHRRRYALKTLTADCTISEEARGRFIREIQICLQLRHPNICRMVDWDFDPRGTPYIVMELLQGEVLSDQITRRTPMSEDAVRLIIKQLLLGLDAIHTARVVHRDLKPANLFMLPDGTLKIMDFGLAWQSGAKTLTGAGTALGTPLYMAPEQLLDTHHVDARADIFNVGLIAYKMFTGHLPVECRRMRDWMRHWKQGTQVPVGSHRPDLSQAAQDWVNKLLQLSPEQRFDSALAALNAIDW
jgi:serine/threonine-protein kinase